MYWKVTCEIIQECVRKSAEPKDIVALSTSSALPAMVMVDEQEILLTEHII